MNPLYEIQQRLEKLRKEGRPHHSIEQLKAIAALTEISENLTVFPQVPDATLRKCIEALGPRITVGILRENMPSPTGLAPQPTAISASVWDQLPSSLEAVGKYLREFLRIPVEYLTDLIPALELAPAIFGGEASVDEVRGIAYTKVALSRPTKWKARKFGHPDK